MNEYPLLAEEFEFINAINLYRQRHGRPFPTWSEVLHVLRFLGYTKPAPAAAPGTASMAAAESPGASAERGDAAGKDAGEDAARS